MTEKTEPKRKRCRPEGIPEETYEHMRAAHAEIRESFLALLPPGFIEHRKAARKEMLLAAQAVVSHAIERVDASEKG